MVYVGDRRGEGGGGGVNKSYLVNGGEEGGGAREARGVGSRSLENPRTLPLLKKRKFEKLIVINFET